MKALNNNYAKIIKPLLVNENPNGFITRGPYSVKDHKCFTYSMLKGSLDTMVLKGINNQKLINKLILQETKIDDTVYSRYPFLLRHFNTKKLKINTYKALKIIQEKSQSTEEIFSRLRCIQDIHNGTYRISLNPETDGRVHTPITSLPKSVRQHVSYNGKPLVEIDISNAVPFFIFLFLKTSHQKNTPKVFSSSTNNCYPLASFLDVLSSVAFITYSMILKKLRHVDTNEFELLRRTTTTGTFYDQFVEDFKESHSYAELKKMSIENGADFNGSHKDIKRIVKKRMLSMIYAKPKGFKKEQAIFARHFPTLLLALNSAKISGKGKERYKNLSHLFMQFEASIMINLCARRFNQKFARHAPIFTLHDCLITTADYAAKLQEIIESEFLEHFSVKPKLKRQIWN
ncbi:MAG: hypothetical protein JJ975_01490 [Bacteroidia bacterium]|nr:hypothetical protein [Bacteroidia bacterium]